MYRHNAYKKQTTKKQEDSVCTKFFMFYCVLLQWDLFLTLINMQTNVNIKVKINCWVQLGSFIKTESSPSWMKCCQAAVNLFFFLIPHLILTPTLPLWDVVALFLRTSCRQTTEAAAVCLQELFIFTRFYWRGASSLMVKMLFSALEMFLNPHLWSFFKLLLLLLICFYQIFLASSVN